MEQTEAELVRSGVRWALNVLLFIVIVALLTTHL